MKKFALGAAAVAACMVMAFSSVTMAASAEIVINGYTCSFSTAPTVENGVVYVPVRGILEALGAKVNWNDYTKTVTATKGTKRIVMRDGTRFMTVNGKSVDMGGQFKLINGVSMVPVRAISEALGATVDYSAATGQVSVTVLGSSIDVNKLNTAAASDIVGSSTSQSYTITADSFTSAQATKQITAKDGSTLAEVNFTYPVISSKNSVASTANKSIEGFLDSIVSDIAEKNTASLTSKKKSAGTAYTPEVITVAYELGDVDSKAAGILFNCTTVGSATVSSEYSTIISFKDGSNSTLKNISGLSEKTANNITLNMFKEKLSNVKANYYKDAFENVKSHMSKLNYFYKDGNVIVMADSSYINGKNERFKITVTKAMLDDILSDNLNNKKYVLDAGQTYLSVDEYAKTVLLPYTGMLNKKNLIIKDSAAISLEDATYIPVRIKGYDGTVYDFAVSQDFKTLKLQDSITGTYKTLN